jgi:hypothetical protein
VAGPRDAVPTFPSFFASKSGKMLLPPRSIHPRPIVGSGPSIFPKAFSYGLSAGRSGTRRTFLIASYPSASLRSHSRGVHVDRLSPPDTCIGLQPREAISMISDVVREAYRESRAVPTPTSIKTLGRKLDPWNQDG